MSAGDAGQPPAEADPAGRRWRPTIAATLTFGFGLLIVVAVTAVLLVSLGTAQRNTEDLNRQLVLLLFASMTGELERHLGGVETALERLDQAVAAGELDLRDRPAVLERLRWSMIDRPQISALALVTDGLAGVSVERRPDGGLVGKLRDDRANADLRAAMNRLRARPQPVWDGVRWIEELESPHLVLGHPLLREGRFVGGLFALISTTELSSFLGELPNTLALRGAILYGRDRVLAHPNFTDALPDVAPEELLPALDQLADPRLAEMWNPPIDGLEELLAGTSLKGHIVEGPQEELLFIYDESWRYGAIPWLITVYADLSAVNVEVQRLGRAGTIGLAILALTVIVALLLGRSIARPIRRLAEAASRVRRLELAAAPRLERNAFREIDDAGLAYNAMVTGLRWFELYLPRRLVRRLMAQGDTAVHSAARSVSVLFTDIADFTALGDRLSPEQLAEFLNHHFALLGACIEAHEGTIDKYIGDSVMAFWGAPDDQPVHPEMACRAALAIAAAIADDNRRRAAAGERPLRLRIGIHTGTAIAGNIGAPGRINYTLIGDTVNVAQRLEGLGKIVFGARDGALAADCVILISEDTRACLPDGYRLRAVGRHRLRGRAGDTAVYALLAGPPGEVPDATRPQVSNSRSPA